MPLPEQSNSRERRLQRGVYDTGRGSIRIDVAEVLIDRGIEVTPEALESAARGLVKASEALGLPAEVIER
jgi:hypothetical protein